MILRARLPVEIPIKTLGNFYVDTINPGFSRMAHHRFAQVLKQRDIDPMLFAKSLDFFFCLWVSETGESLHFHH